MSGKPAETPEPAEPRPVAYGSGRSGPVRAALRKAIKDARDQKRLTPEHEVLAKLADRFADMVDRAAGREDSAMLLRAGARLTELMDALPLRVASGGAPDDSGDGRAQLHSIIGSAPQVGHSAHA